MKYLKLFNENHNSIVNLNSLVNMYLIEDLNDLSLDYTDDGYCVYFGIDVFDNNNDDTALPIYNIYKSSNDIINFQNIEGEYYNTDNLYYNLGSDLIEFLNFANNDCSCTYEVGVLKKTEVSYNFSDSKTKELYEKLKMMYPDEYIFMMDKYSL